MTPVGKQSDCTREIVTLFLFWADILSYVTKLRISHRLLYSRVDISKDPDGQIKLNDWRNELYNNAITKAEHVRNDWDVTTRK